MSYIIFDYSSKIGFVFSDRRLNKRDPKAFMGFYTQNTYKNYSCIPKGEKSLKE